MKWILKTAAALVVLATTVAAGAASAARPPQLDYASELYGRVCGGDLIIDVVFTVQNELAFGEDGDVWAVLNFKRQVRVYQLSETHFCVVGTDRGNWETVGSQSPGGTDARIAAGIKGRFEGGYRTLEFTALLNTSPTLPTRGFIGSFDYGCSPPDPNSCDRFSWRDVYFANGPVLFDDWWGWIYRGGQHGTWVQACTFFDADCPGSSGDITD